MMPTGYKKIADMIEAEIAAGIIAPGTRMPSRREIGVKYSVSGVTAYRAQRELYRRNLVQCNQALGVEVFGPFLPSNASCEGAKLKKIIFVSNSVSTAPDSRIDAVRRLSLARGLEFNVIFGEDVLPTRMGEVYKTDTPDTGYVIVYQNGGKYPRLSQLLALAPGAHTVMMGAVFPYSHSVVYDVRRGMAEIVAFVRSRGKRRVLYTDHFYLLGSYNNAARRLGCEEACEKFGMAFSLVDHADYAGILNAVRSSAPPDAIICSQDAVAMRIFQLFESEGVPAASRPMLTGFDGESLIGVPPNLTTYECDPVPLAEKAFEILLTRPRQPAIYDTVLIHGRLVKGR